MGATDLPMINVHYPDEPPKPPGTIDSDGPEKEKTSVINHDGGTTSPAVTGNAAARVHAGRHSGEDLAAESWEQVKDRIDQATADQFAGTNATPEGVQEFRDEMAKQEGYLAGLNAGPTTAMARSASDAALPGVGDWLEGHTPWWLGGQSTLSGSEGTAFANGVTAGAADANPVGSTLATGAGYLAGPEGKAQGVGQALRLLGRTGTTAIKWVGRKLSRQKGKPTETIVQKKRKKKDCKPCDANGNPVYASSGLPVINDPGFVVDGLIPVNLSSIYEGNANVVTPVGRNRCTELDAYIFRDEDGRLKLSDESFFPTTFNQPSANPRHWEEGDTAANLAIALDESRELLVRDGVLTKTFRKFKDGFWRLCAISHRNGAVARLQRTQNGVLTGIALPDGLRVVFDNEATTGYRLAAHLVAPGGERKTVLRYTYDKRGNATEIVAPYSGWMRHTYDADDHIVDTERSHGHRVRREYDAQGRVVAERTNSAYNNASFTYDDRLNINTYLPFGGEASFEKYYLDADKHIVARANALGLFTRTEYDEFGSVSATVNAEGERTEYTHHADGSLRSVSDGEGRETFYYYGAFGNPEIVIDPTGKSWDYEYDQNGNLTAIVSPLGYRTDITNTAFGQPTGIMRHDGLIEQRQYDAHHRLAAVVDFRGETTRFERDAFGRIVAVRDPGGGVTRFAYADELGVDFWQPSRIVRPDGGEVATTTLANATEVRSKDAEGRVTTYRYGFGPNNRLTEIEDAKGGVLRFEYDSIERLTRVRNQRGLYWTFERDAAGRIIRETDFSGLVVEYAYDGADRVIETRHADGARLVFAYDKSGLLVREELHEKGVAEPKVTTFAYDGRGLLEATENSDAKVCFDRDAAGQIVKETINGREVKSTFDCCGNRTGREIGGRLVRSIYDPLGALKQVTIGGHASLAFTRDAMGREKMRETPAGFHLAQDYDAVGQLTAQVAGLAIRGMEGAIAAQRAGIRPQEAGRAIERRYAWSKAFEPVTISDRVWGETAYRYDPNGQVTEARFGTNEAERFEYDAALNISGFAEGPAPKPVPRQTYYPAAGDGWRPPEPPNPHLAWSLADGGQVKVARGPKGEKVFLSHDVRGRVIERRVERNGFRAGTWRYGWDGKDRLVKCITPDHETWAFGYDPFGRRVWKKRELTEGEKRYYVLKYPRAVDAASIPDRGVHYIDAVPAKGVDSREELDGLAPVIGVAYQWDGNLIAEEAPLRLDGSIDWDKATRWHYEPGTFRPLAKEEPIRRERWQRHPSLPTHRLLYIVTDHLGTPREMFAENGRPVWAASYTTWGRVRALRTAPMPANDDDPTFAGMSLGDGNVSGGTSVGQTNARAIASYMRSGPVQGNLALKPAPEEAAFACPIRFQGQWEDEETGLYYNRFRYYDPLVGQYMSPDPGGLLGGVRPQGYVHSPNAWIDPLGLEEKVLNFGSYEQARNQALKDLQKAGGLNPSTRCCLKAKSFGGKNPAGGQTVGFSGKTNAGDPVNYRLDYDPTKGPHINLSTGGVNNAYVFPGNQQGYLNLLRQFQ